MLVSLVSPALPTVIILASFLVTYNRLVSQAWKSRHRATVHDKPTSFEQNRSYEIKNVVVHGLCADRVLTVTIYFNEKAFSTLDLRKT